MDIVTSENKAHWYDIPSKQSRHYTPYADKKRKGEMRKTTLSDARKAGYAPSVTTILDVISKPGLEMWKLETAIMAALTLPQEQGEVTDAFAKRIVEDMKTSARKAADKGKKIHNAAERFLKGQAIYLEPELNELFFPLMNWLEHEVQEVIMAEQVLVHPGDQYAGTVDLIAILKSYGPMVVDIKTQGIKKGKPTIYPEWSLQLEAYRQAYYKLPKFLSVGLLSLVVSSEEPLEPLAHQWPEEGSTDRILAFRAAQDLWRWQRSYPRTEITELEVF